MGFFVTLTMNTASSAANPLVAMEINVHPSPSLRDVTATIVLGKYFNIHTV